MIDFKTLRVWENFHTIPLQVYSMTRKFPTEELYGLTLQIRRSVASVAANIAEGCGRGSDAELNRFLVIAMGSACELEYQLLLTRDLDYLSETDYNTILKELTTAKKMLTVSLKKSKQEYSPNP